MPAITRELLERLPKTDLHCHLDGSMRLQTILSLAESYKIRLPADNEDDLRKLIVMNEGCSSLVDYLKVFDVTLLVLQTDEALERAAYELAEDAAHENVRYLEVRFAPILHTNSLLPFEKIFESVIAGLLRAEKRYKIKTGLLVCGMRNFPSEISHMARRLHDRLYTFSDVELSRILAIQTAKVTTRLSEKYPTIVGFDIAGPESGYPAKDFYDAFQEIINGHMSITIHAGEAYGPESIEQAVKYCHAHRIGHGTRLIEAKDDSRLRTLYRYFKDKRIPIEICLTSNLQTGTVKSIENHPIKTFLEDKLRCTICTDNRLVSDTTVTDEYLRLAETFNLSAKDLYKLVIYGFESTFLPYEEREAILREVEPILARELLGTPA
ncbi:MAG: adenosine deaminase family protein [Candidatus Riflebacteria bacterium]|nr:adenosine deaminase family protein [Candidatus Riflebacteria bacterium]